MDYAGRTALVTGASSGIGAAFARELAARGANLVLVARREDRLQELATELRDAYGVCVEVIPQDLARADAAAAIAGRMTELGREVDLLVNNAGFASYGDVAEADPGRLVDEVTVNCTALVELTRGVLPGMLARGGGAIVNLASTTAFLPVPHMAVYAATKAFVLSFTEALGAEIPRDRVRILALCPGGTETEFFGVAGRDVSFGIRQSPAAVASAALLALDRGRPVLVP
ncbi:MAG: SDR family oxidoreductase, partial [Candidatus Dormiibacterota bacterium]